jgi:hypothetical protein
VLVAHACHLTTFKFNNIGKFKDIGEKIISYKCKLKIVGMSQVLWHTYVIPALGKWRQKDEQSSRPVLLGSIVNLRPGWAT